MSLDAAAAMVDAMINPAPEPAAETPKEPAAAPVEAPAEEIAPEPAEAEAEAVEGAEDDEEAVEAVEPVEAPQWYDADAKAAFTKLPPDMQAIVRAQEDKREAVVQKEKTAAIEARKAAAAEVESVRQIAAKLDGIVPDKMAAFEAKYKDIDWNAFPDWARVNPAEANTFLAEYNAEKIALEKMMTAQAEATRVAQASFAREQAARLAEIAPDLIKTPENLKALGDYAVKNGVKSEDLMFAEADHLVILNKARLYDDMMAKAAAKPITPPVAKTTAPAKIAPQGASGRSTGTSQQREVTQLRNRLAQTRDIDTAANLISKLGF
jgi:hypothetical protein